MKPLDSILVTANNAWNLASFQAPILRALVAEGYRVVRPTKVGMSKSAQG